MTRRRKKAPEKAITTVKTKNNFEGPLQIGLLLGFIVLVTYFTFTPALKANFINWDDNAYVFKNPELNRPLLGAIGYFFAPHYFIGNYVPLTMIVYSLQFHTAALDPHFYHLVNLLLHLVNVMLVFWFIYLLSGKKPVVAAVVAFFFGVHPMHVESVAWVAELKDVLYTAFFLASLIFYLKNLERRSALDQSEEMSPEGGKKDYTKRFPGGFLIWAFILFLCSLLSKPAAVVLPLVLLLIDYYRFRKFTPAVWLEKLPFFVISLIFGIIAIQAQQADRLIHDFHPVWQRFFFASHSSITYIVKLLLPFNLSIFYPYPDLYKGHLPVEYYLSPLLLIAVCYGVFRTLKFSRLVVFGFLFFFVNIMLVLQILSVGDAILAERYTYVAYIGLFFIMAMVVQKLMDNPLQKSKPYARAVLGIVFVFGLGCAYLSHARCKVWKNEYIISADLLSKYPDDRLALNNRGYLLFEQGNYEESVKLFLKAIERKPDYVMAYINLINSYQMLNRYDDAFATTEKALKVAPRDHNLLNKKGYLLFMKGKNTEALKYYLQANAIKPDDVNSYIYLAECYYALKDLENGMKFVDKGLLYEPHNYVLLNNKGYILYVQGKFKEAIPYYKASLDSRPDYQIATVNLQDCYKALDQASQRKN